MCVALVLAGSVPAEALFRAVVREYEARMTKRVQTAQMAPATTEATTARTTSEPYGTFRAPTSAPAGGSHDRAANVLLHRVSTADSWHPSYAAPFARASQPSIAIPRQTVTRAPGGPSISGQQRTMPPVPATTYNGNFVVDTTDNPGGQNTLTTGNTITIIGGDTIIGQNHTGVFTQSGGTFNTSAANSLVLGQKMGSNGTFNLQGGNLTAAYTYVGFLGPGTFNQTGGSFVVSGSTAQLAIGSNSANGAYVLSGSASLTTPQTVVSNGANTSTFTQSGTSTHTTGSLIIGNHSFLGVPSVGTYNLDGGTLTTGQIGTYTNGDATSTFNFNSGTLRASTSDSPGTSTFFSGLTTANVRNGGAIIDTNGFNVTIAQGLLHSGIAGDNATDGGLIKSGAGTLTLTGVNTYTGGTSVNAGTLAVPAGSLTNTGNVYVNPNSTLALSGSGNIAVNALAVSGGTFNQSGGTFGSANTGIVAIGYGGTGTANQTGGTLKGNSLIIGYGGTTTASTYNLSGANSQILVNSVLVGFGSDGTFVQSDGSVTSTGLNASDMTFVLGNFAGVTGTYMMSGGSLSTGIANVGYKGSGLFSQSGGHFTTNGYPLSVGGATAESGGYALSAGTLETGSTAIVGGSGSSYFTQSGGTHLTGAVTIGSAGTGAAGVYNLDGGTLQASSITGGTGTSRLLFNGGIVQPRGDSTNFISGITGANVRGGGAIFDTNSKNVTVPQLLAHSNFEGDNAIDGGLTKNSMGSLTLTANNTYTGRTFVAGGALYVNNVAVAAGDSGTGSGPVYVGNNAWLGGNGTIAGSVTVGASPPTMLMASVQPDFVVTRGVLTPGVNGPGILTINADLTLAATAAYEVDLGGLAAGSGYDQTKVGGNITIDGILALTLTNSFKPVLGEKFFVLNITSDGGHVSGIFANATAGNLINDNAGNTYLINYLDDIGDGEALNDVSLTVVAVAIPEPGTWAMVVVGAGALALAFRRRRAA